MFWADGAATCRGRTLARRSNVGVMAPSWSSVVHKQVKPGGTADSVSATGGGGQLTRFLGTYPCPISPKDPTCSHRSQTTAALGYKRHRVDVRSTTNRAGGI